MGGNSLLGPCKSFILIMESYWRLVTLIPPQKNRRVECKHRHILNVARTLRFQACLRISFWGECVLTAAYLINRTPSKLLKGKTPHEVLFGCKPSYDEVRVFGVLCFA